MIIGLWLWLFPAVPLGGQTWRMYDTGDEVRVVRVSSRWTQIRRADASPRRSTESNYDFFAPFVEYRTPDGRLCRANYRSFRRLGRPVPTYIPASAEPEM